MKRLFFTLTTFLMMLPTVAFAGGPNAESPEPGFWLFLALGVLPILMFAWKNYSREESTVAVKSMEQ